MAEIVPQTFVIIWHNGTEGTTRQDVQIVQYRGTENLHAQHLFNLVKCTFNMSCFSSFCCNMVTGTVDSVISVLEEAYLPPFKIDCVMREGLWAISPPRFGG